MFGLECPFLFSVAQLEQNFALLSRVTKARYGLVHVALAHHYPSQERWYVVSDQPTTTDTFVEYGLRFDIEDRQNLSAYLRLIGLSAIAENPGIATQSS